MIETLKNAHVKPEIKERYDLVEIRENGTTRTLAHSSNATRILELLDNMRAKNLGFTIGMEVKSGRYFP